MALLAPPRSDGSELFTALCDHFLHHEPLRLWLMNHNPADAPRPRDIDSSIAFCCAFPVPPKFAAIASSFAMGEMMVPVRSYGRFICGVVVAATNIHKYAACIADAIDPLRSDSKHRTFRSATRRIICDVGINPDDPVNLIDFAWMEDSSLIISTKVLIPPVDGLHHGSCTGSFGIFYDPSQRAKIPDRPDYVVSYAEVPHCVFCAARGTSGCMCTSASGTNAAPIYIPPLPLPAPPGHLISPPSEIPGATLAARIGAINRYATVRITARKGVWRTQSLDGIPVYTLERLRHQLQPTVLFSMSSEAHFHTLRQIAAISTNLGAPANIASARLLHDTVGPDSPDEFRKRHAINTEILNALVPPEKQEPSLTTEVPPSSAATHAYIDDIDFTFAHDPAFTSPEFATPPLPPAVAPAAPAVAASSAFELSPMTGSDKIALDKFFPYRPTLETASPTYTPMQSSRLVSELIESPQYSAKPADAVAAFLDLPTAPNPPMPATPALLSIGAVSPVTPPLTDHAPVQLSAVTEAVPKARETKARETRGEVASTTKRVRHVPSSGVCAVCGKYFFKSGALVRHTRSAHPEIAVARDSRPSSGSAASGTTAAASGSSSNGRHPTTRLDCPRCSKTFSQQGSLNRHLRSIHEERKLHCRYCDLAFGQAFDLKRHQRRKHPGSVLVVPSEALPRFAMRQRPFCDVRQEG